MKNRIDWFYFVIGTAFLIMGVVLIIRENDWFVILINFLLGVMSLFKAYYQDRMSILYWIRRKK